MYNSKDVLKLECGKKIELDIYFPNFKLAFEVNGDFWHANPELYNSDDINEKIGISAQEIWDRDTLKKNVCENMGISLYTIWENDWKHNNADVKERIKNILEGYEKEGC